MTRFSKAALISQDSASVRGAIGVLIKSLLLVGKVTKFSVIVSHRDKQVIQHTSKQGASEKEANREREGG